MKNHQSICSLATLFAAVLVSGAAQATLILDTTVTTSFNGQVDRVSTSGNDLPGVPDWLLLGQLKTTAAGYVDFFYVGHEAGYTNSLLIGGNIANATDNAPDTFDAPYVLLGSIGIGAGELLDFGFCTSGGADLASWGRCAHNNSAASLIAQFNHDDASGYRSIALLPLTSFDGNSGDIGFGALGNGVSDLWMMLWDDSGAENDDNHDDYVAVARFRPVAVPEPATAALLGIGLVLIGFLRRRRAAI